jgi:small subunit ribosomal protein S17
MSVNISEEAAGQKSVRKVSGQVVSDKMDKTIAVSIQRVVKHPVYGKYIRRTSKVLAHDEDNSCKTGDVVAISECKPRSKRKAWRVVEILKRAEAQ